MREKYKRLATPQLEAFAAVVCQLPPKYQEAVKSFLAGKTHAEIAVALGVSRPRVSKMLKRGLEVVEQVLSD